MSASGSEKESRLTPEPKGMTTSTQPHSTADAAAAQAAGAAALAATAGQMRSRGTARVPRSGRRAVDFGLINTAALQVMPALLTRWLPSGHREGREWVALNPRRGDQHLGSFRINLDTGRWADFATEDRGGDPISLLAFLNDCSQLDAARDLAAMLRLSERQVHHG